MRFLTTDADGALSLTKDLETPPDRYAVLSHTWASDVDEEVTIDDILNKKNAGKTSYCKLHFCTNQIQKDGLKYVWVDTCCIDQSNSAELSEAINSMFRWYGGSDRCYVYLSDVSVGGGGLEDGSWLRAFRDTKWHTRGWTLQELLAPKSVEFFSAEGVFLGNKLTLESVLHEVTGIPIRALQGEPLSSFSIKERFAWAEKRATRKAEDKWYCLLGVFGVSMSWRGGEGEPSARQRLMRKIVGSSDEFLRSIYTTEYQACLENVAERATTGTCLWFWKHPIFIKWSSDQRGSILWYSADHGTGKSVLCRHVIEAYRHKLPGVTVLYFLFDECRPQCSTVEAAFQALLHQLCESSHELLIEANNYSQHHGRSSSKRRTSLCQMLKDCLYQSKVKETIIVLDGFDQCGDMREAQDCFRFYEILGELMEHLTPSGRVLRVFISTRPRWLHLQPIRELVESKGYYHLTGEAEAENICADIRTFVDEWLGRIAQRMSLSQQELSTFKLWLYDAQHYNFLCVRSTTEYLFAEPQRTLDSLWDRLRHIPPRVGDLWARALESCPRKHEARMAFAAIITARQPLSVSQLYAVIEQKSSVTHQSTPEPRLIDDIRYTCGLLVRVNADRVYLAHNSLRSFLLGIEHSRVSMRKFRALAISGWPKIISEVEGEILLATACIRCYRSAAGLLSDFWASFWPYTRKHGTDHVTAALLKSRQYQKLPLSRVFGLGLDPQMVDDRGRSLLHRAVDAFDVDINLVKTLIHHGGLVQSADRYNMTCLHYASMKSNLHLLGLLIDAGFNINKGVRRESAYAPARTALRHDTSSGGLTSLHIASLYGRNEAICLLLARGADPEVSDEFGTTPLHLALHCLLPEADHLNDSWTVDEAMPEWIEHYDNEENTRTLLESAAIWREVGLRSLCKAVNVGDTHRDSFGRTALHCVRYGKLTSADNTVSILMDQGYKPTTRDKEEKTPVLYAARAGDTLSLQKLIQTKTCLSTTDCYGMSALHYAVQGNHLEATQFILSSAESQSIKDEHGRTALHYLGDSAIAQVLLASGYKASDVDDKGRDSLAHYLTLPLLLGGDKAIIERLLKHGANAGHVEVNGQNLAHMFVRSEDEVRVDGLLLLEAAGVDSTAVDLQCRTILHTAAIAGSLNSSLLAHMTHCKKMDIKQCDRDGKTPLDYIAKARSRWLPPDMFRKDRFEDAWQAIVKHRAPGSSPKTCNCMLTSDPGQQATGIAVQESAVIGSLFD